VVVHFCYKIVLPLFFGNKIKFQGIWTKQVRGHYRESMKSTLRGIACVEREIGRINLDEGR